MDLKMWKRKIFHFCFVNSVQGLCALCGKNYLTEFNDLQAANAQRKNLRIGDDLATGKSN